MNKVFLIIQREYLTRVKKKSFIIMTLLSPVIFAAMMVVPAWLSSQKDTNEKNIAIEDNSGLYHSAFKSSQYIKYQYLKPESASNKKEIINNKIDALLVINSNLLHNPDDIHLYSDGQVTLDVINHIKQNINSHLRTEKLSSYNIEGLDEKIKEINKVKVKINTIRLDDDGTEKQSSAEFALAIGMISALLIYFIMIIYGTQVMRGVIEEKTNRIVEVIISSVKPFQLMIGKIVGIGLVALTQFFLWIVLTAGVVFFVQLSFSGGTSDKVEITQTVDTPQEVGTQSADQAHEVQKTINKILGILKDANMPLILGLFIFYFIGGYLIYSALFAAIGSAIDNETETQQFVMPVLLPLILSIYVAMAAFRSPHGDISFWFSMFPLTSPVVMMSRIPFDVPLWELLLSMTILTASFIFFTWFAGRVYRTGILMYGKKVSYKEIWKWFIQAGK
ncbi:ABC transporter permease [Labilibacter sediminis]|nr:ABC transporter permease [Labilibacter sediminis]